MTTKPETEVAEKILAEIAKEPDRPLYRIVALLHSFAQSVKEGERERCAGIATGFKSQRGAGDGIKRPNMALRIAAAN